MDEQDFFRRELFRECNKRFPRCVRAELKLFDVTAHGLRGLASVKRHLFVRQRVSQNSSGRLRSGVPDEENGMARLIDDSLRESVGECFRRHHSAGKSVNTSRSCPRLVNCLGVQDKWAKFIEQLQAWQLTPAHLCPPIVNVADL